MKVLESLYRIRTVQLLKKKNYLGFILGMTDMSLLMVTFQMSYYFVEGRNHAFFLLNTKYLLLFLYMVPSWILILHVCNLAHIPRTSRYSRIFLSYAQFTILNLVILYLYSLIFGFEYISNTFIILFASIGLVVLYTARILEFKVVKNFRANGHNVLNVILIADKSSEQLIHELLTKKEWGYRILFVFSNSNLLKLKYGDKLKFLPEKSLPTLKNMLEFDIVDEVLYLKSEIIQSEIRECLRSCEEIGVVFRLKTDVSPFFLTNGRLSRIGNHKFLVFVNIPTNSIGLALKTTTDIYLSFIMLILFSPVMIIIATCIVIDSPGPILFRQARVGLRGRQFYLYKFRTMVANAEQLRKNLEHQNEMDGPVFKIKADPRITSVGKFLRKSGLDELPQLFNVLKGEMSLIGPRPPLQSETIHYKRWQLRRLSVKPGITCSWQIIPDRNSVKFNQWMKLDLAYIDKWSPLLDLKLLLKTVRTVIFGTGK